MELVLVDQEGLTLFSDQFISIGERVDSMVEPCALDEGGSLLDVFAREPGPSRRGSLRECVVEPRPIVNRFFIQLSARQHGPGVLEDHKSVQCASRRRPIHSGALLLHRNQLFLLQFSAVARRFCPSQVIATPQLGPLPEFDQMRAQRPLQLQPVERRCGGGQIGEG